MKKNETNTIQIHFQNLSKQTTIIPPNALFLGLPEREQDIGKRMVLESNGRDFVAISRPLTEFYILFIKGSKRVFFS